MRSWKNVDVDTNNFNYFQNNFHFEKWKYTAILLQFFSSENVKATETNMDMMSNWLDLLKSLNSIFPKYSQSFAFNLKPKQVLCLDYLRNGEDFIAVLPATGTGFGKSLIFHLLPFISWQYSPSLLHHYPLSLEVR